MKHNLLPRPVLFIFAVIFLFESWIWDSLYWCLAWISRQLPWERIKRTALIVIDRMPAIFAVLLFGVPVVVMELGSFFSVVAIALGHVILGAVCYVLLKLVGVSLIAVVYDLTQHKLMSLPWFVWLNEKFQRMHHVAHEFVAPYRQAGITQLIGVKHRLASAWGPGRPDLLRLRRWVRTRRSLTPDAEFDL